MRVAALLVAHYLISMRLDYRQGGTMQHHRGLAVVTLAVAALPLAGWSATHPDGVYSARDAGVAVTEEPVTEEPDDGPEATPTDEEPQATSEPSPTPAQTPEPDSTPLIPPPPVPLAARIVDPAADAVPVAWVDDDPNSGQPTAGRSGVTLNDVNIVARTGYTGTTGILANSTTGLTVNGYTFDGGEGYAGSYGISARAASGMVVADATITDVGVGYFVHGSESPAVGVKMTNVTIDAKTFGVQVGGSVSPEFRGVTITTPAAVANAAAIDLATSTGAVIDNARLSGFAYGVKSIATSGPGAQISDSRITATLVGVALGTTTDPSITSTTIVGGSPGLNTSFGIESNVTGLTLSDVAIEGFPTGMRTRAASGTGTTATNLTIKGATVNGLFLGTTDGNTLTDVQVLASGATPAATTVAVQLGGSQNVTITRAVVDGYPTSIGTGAVGNAGPAKQNLVVTGSTFTNVTSGISANNFDHVTVRDVTVTTNAPRGSGVYSRDNANVLIENLTVNGTRNTSDLRLGTYGVRTYYTRGITVRDSLFNGGGAGKVLYPEQCVDLTLTASAVATDASTAPTAHEGDLVTWTLTPGNVGLVAAPAGWTVTQVLPEQLELVEMTGDGYTFDGPVATAEDDLAVGADGPVITVVARVRALTWETDQTTQDLQHVAYVAPLAPELATDLDGDGFPDVRIEYPNPLVVPEIGDDTDQTATNNDTQGRLTVSRSISPAPEPTESPEATEPAASPEPTSPTVLPDGGPSPTADGEATGGASTGGNALTRTGNDILAWTGDNILAVLAVAAIALASGSVLFAVRRRRASHRR